MKRFLSLLMALSILLAGCGGQNATSPETEAAGTETVVETTAALTLSPEEVLYNSLTDRQKQAVDLGILELSQLEDPERVVTVGEACAMLQKAYVHRTGVESMALRDLMADPDLGTQNATRGWVMQIPGLTDMELIAGDSYQDYGQWLQFLDKGGGSLGKDTSQLWWSFPMRYGLTSPMVVEDQGMYSVSESGSLIWNMWHGTVPGVADSEEIYTLMEESRLYGPVFQPGGGRYEPVREYAFKVFDSTTGKKFFTLKDGLIQWTEELTAADMAEYALIFYHYPNPMGYPEYVAPEEVGRYHPEIITAELLTKETDLPVPTCQELPGSWRGVVVDDMSYQGNFHMDDHVYEYEIQAIKEAGFNYIGLHLDFDWLQDYYLTNDNWQAYKKFIAKEDQGKLNIQRLEQLDQVIAWCIQYDIHVNLRAVSLGQYNGRAFYSTVPDGEDIADLWGAIARRYADIPNEYLSFTLLSNCSGYGFNVRSADLIPSIAAIRESTPERCIIAEIYDTWKNWVTAQPFAEQGVALSYRITEWLDDQNPMIWNLWYRNNFKEEGIPVEKGTPMPAQRFQREDYVKKFTWPYNETMDAQSMPTASYAGGDTWQDTMDIAQEYGVGFMLSDFGVRAIAPDGGDWYYPRYRYPDEAYRAMITDITSTVEDMGYSWCFASWYGLYGAAFCIPAIEHTAYEQVEDYPYYIDQTMLEWFRQINGVE